jgi:hypothetical protein
LSLLKLFKTCEISTGQLLKVVGAVPSAFLKRIFHRQPICQLSQSARFRLAGFPKLSVPIGAKDLISQVLKSFQKIQKLLALNSSEIINSVLKLKVLFKIF